MARLGAGAFQLFATLLVVTLAARGAAAKIPIPSLLTTSDGGLISFIDLKNTSAITGVDLLAAEVSFTPSLLGSAADSKWAFTIALAAPGDRYRVFVTDLATFSKPKVLGNLLLPNAAFKKGCVAPVNKLMTMIRTSSSSYKLFVATHCTAPAAKKCAAATGQKTADVISVYSYTYNVAPGKLGKLVAGPKAVLPVPECTRATLIGTQVNDGAVQLLVTTFATARNQAVKVGDLAVFVLKSGFVRVAGKLVNKLSLAKTYRSAFSGLVINAGVPASASSHICVATNAKGQAKIYSFAAGREGYVGGYAGTKTRFYDSICSVGGNAYSALEDATGLPAGDPGVGLIQLSTPLSLKTNKVGPIIAQDIVSFFEIAYVGKA